MGAKVEIGRHYFVSFVNWISSVADVPIGAPFVPRSIAYRKVTGEKRSSRASPAAGHKAFTLMFSEANSSAKQCFQTNQTGTIATVWHQHTLLGRR
jgi:hypothetical protein